MFYELTFSPSVTAAPRAATPERVRSLLSRFGGAVTFISGESETGPVGLTATSFSSISIEPPLVTFSVSSSSSTFESMSCAESVVIHFLSTDDIWLARLGATSGVDRFSDASSWGRAATGEPVFWSIRNWVRGHVVEHVKFRSCSLQIVQLDFGAFEGETNIGSMSDPLLYSEHRWGRFRGLSPTL